MRGLALLAAAGVLLAWPATSAGTIVVQKGIAGVGLRMTKAQVRAKLGPPARVVSAVNDFGPYTNFVYRRVTVSFQGRQRVTGLRTTSPREVTTSGVGVGSREAHVRTAVPGVKCKATLGSRQCVVGTFKPGRVVTVFLLTKGRVSVVIVGFVLD